jgi:hypothetical protein
MGVPIFMKDDVSLRRFESSFVNLDAS